MVQDETTGPRYRTDKGCTGGGDIQERQASEVADIQKKYRQRLPEIPDIYQEGRQRWDNGTDKIVFEPGSVLTVEDAIVISKNVIIKAVASFANRMNERDLNSIRNWLASRYIGLQSLSHHCAVAGWDEDWVMKIFRGLDSLPDSTRPDIGRQIVAMLKTV